MSSAKVYAEPGRNRLLSLLPAAERARLQPHLEQVTLSWKDPIYEPDQPVPYVYFPSTMVGSLVIEMDEGESAE